MPILDSSVITWVRKSIPPTTSDVFGELTAWLDEATNKVYLLTDVTAGVATWKELSGTSPFTTDVVPKVADSTAKSALVKIKGKTVYQVDEVRMYVCVAGL
jgi:hypothetical protein